MSGVGHNSRVISAVRGTMRRVNQLAAQRRALVAEEVMAIRALHAEHGIEPQVFRELRRWLKDPEGFERRLMEAGALQPELGDEREAAVRAREEAAKSRAGSTETKRGATAQETANGDEPVAFSAKASGGRR